MKQVDIVFTKSKKFMPLGSWIIRLWTRKSYSHVARGLQVHNWAYLYYQANEGKVNYEVDEAFNKKHEIVVKYTIAVPKILETLIRKECILDAGKKYGTMQNIGIGLVDIVYKITGKTIKNPWTDGRNCSELLYENIFKHMVPSLDYNKDTIKPHQIEEIIIEHFELREGVWIHKQEK